MTWRLFVAESLSESVVGGILSIKPYGAYSNEILFEIQQLVSIQENVFENAITVDSYFNRPRMPSQWRHT